MAGLRFLREQTVGETRWAALDGSGRLIGLYIERPTLQAPLGALIHARIGKTEPGAGGTFVDIPGSKGAFLRAPSEKKGKPQPPPMPSEGSAVTIEIMAEARGEKLPRARLSTSAPLSAPLHASGWRQTFKNGAAAPIADVAPGDASMAGFFEDALSRDVTLPGGGKLRIERTTALTAVDIDTAGRSAKGSAGARALSLNRIAAEELARQILIRGLGGLIVLDCVSPLNQEAGTRIRAAYLDSWAALSQRTARVLPPSALGLMEIACDWQITPLAEHLIDSAGHPLPEAMALDGLRLLQREAEQNRMGTLTLLLPEAAYSWLQNSTLNAESELAAKYGARLKIMAHTKPSPEVSSHHE